MMTKENECKAKEAKKKKYDKHEYLFKNKK